MRSWLAATLILSAAGAAAQAQMVAAPTTAGAKPKRVATVPIRPPGLQTPADTANAMAQAERLALQSDLAWVGEYNGAITGDVSERMVDAIKDISEAQRRPAERRAQSAGARGAGRNRAAAAGQCRLEDRHRSRHGLAARHSHQTRAAADQRRQRHQMELADRHHAGAADPAQGSEPDHGQARRAREKGGRAAPSTTPWSSRISSCCRDCRG